MTNPEISSIGNHYADFVATKLGALIGQTITTELVEQISMIVADHSADLLNQREAAELLGISINGFLYATGHNTQAPTDPAPVIEKPPLWQRDDLETFKAKRQQLALHDGRISGNR